MLEGFFGIFTNAAGRRDWYKGAGIADTEGGTLVRTIMKGLAVAAGLGTAAVLAWWAYSFTEQQGFASWWAWSSGAGMVLALGFMVSIPAGLYFEISARRQRNRQRQAGEELLAAQFDAERSGIEAKRQAAREAGELPEYLPPEQAPLSRGQRIRQWLLSLVRDRVTPGPGWGDESPRQVLARTGRDFTTHYSNGRKRPEPPKARRKFSSVP